MHKLGTYRKIDGKNFKAVASSYRKTEAEKKADSLRKRYKYVRMIQIDKEWYVFARGKK